jgi:hypothetical protein
MTILLQCMLLKLSIVLRYYTNRNKYKVTFKRYSACHNNTNRQKLIVPDHFPFCQLDRNDKVGKWQNYATLFTYQHMITQYGTHYSNHITKIETFEA